MSETRIAPNASANASSQEGVQLIDSGAALTRLHYFDGKFLRADALTLEQDYHRRLVRLANLAGGWGVVHGLGVTLDGARLRVTAGLAITPAGSTVLLEHEVSPSVAALVASAAAPIDPATGKPVFADCPEHAEKLPEASLGHAIYEITAGPLERLCGQEEVYGKLCEDACVTDSQAPYWREGLWLRARPVALALPAAASVAAGPQHLRNRVAAAYFAAEPWLTPSLVSAAGLAAPGWCQPAALYQRDEVPLGLLVREGGTTRFVDAWSARRERMDSQARGYWQGRMAMRPWNVFLAQILQFQCQLAGAFRPDGKLFEPLDDDCRRLRLLVEETLARVEKARRQYESGAQKIVSLLGDAAAGAAEETLRFLKRPQQQLADIERHVADARNGFAAMPKNRLLIEAGFLDLPPAGYLPVSPGKTPVNEPLGRLFGEGVELRFCVARHDAIAHALEEAQHMERISLTRGLDDPAQREQVEIFVPDGEIVDVAGTASGSHWRVQMNPLLWTVVELALRGAAKASAREAVARAAFRPEAVRDTVENSLAEFTRLPELSSNPLEGVARSARTDGGGARLTLVASATGAAAAPEAEAEKLPDAHKVPVPAPAPAPAPATAAVAAAEAEAEAEADVDVVAEAAQPTLLLMRAMRINTNVNITTSPLRAPPAALYADFLVAADPFAAGEGDELPVSFAFRTAHPAAPRFATHAAAAAAMLGTQGDGDGRLVIESIGPVEDELAELSGRLVLHLRVRETLGSDSEDNNLTLDFRVRLRRIGSARSGRILILPAIGSGAPMPWEALWRGTPREALFGLVAAEDAVKFDASADKLSHFREAAAAAAAAARAAAEAARAHPSAVMARLGNLARMSRFDLAGLKVLARLAEVPAGIKPESAPRLAALNTLALLGEATGDEGFAAVARRRLFPDEAPALEAQVRALRDWVMFRRRRDVRCDQAPAAGRPTVVESFQTWHLRLKGAGELAKFAAALKKNDAAAFKGFQFARVDVLQYADEASTPLAPSAAVVAAWSAAAPARNLALARVWESAPATGQGWQNHVRLKRLVDTLGALIDAPGEGVVRATPEAPAPLDDPRYDGGMLLVTTDEAPAAGATHVLVRLPSTNADLLQALLKNEPAKIPTALRSNLSDGQFVDLPYDAASATPQAAALKKAIDDWASSQTVVGVVRLFAAAADAARVELERKLSDTVLRSFDAPTTNVDERVIDVPGFVTPPAAGDPAALAVTVLIVRATLRSAPRSRRKPA